MTFGGSSFGGGYFGGAPLYPSSTLFPGATVLPGGAATSTMQDPVVVSDWFTKASFQSEQQASASARVPSSVTRPRCSGLRDQLRLERVGVAQPLPAVTAVTAVTGTWPG